MLNLREARQTWKLPEVVIGTGTVVPLGESELDTFSGGIRNVDCTVATSCRSSASITNVLQIPC
jgi:hypothetical protein